MTDVHPQGWCSFCFKRCWCIAADTHSRATGVQSHASLCRLVCSAHCSVLSVPATTSSTTPCTLAACVIAVHSTVAAHKSTERASSYLCASCFVDVLFLACENRSSTSSSRVWQVCPASEGATIVSRFSFLINHVCANVT
jgi:hypothetical protein